jgi:hypothetical protein
MNEYEYLNDTIARETAYTEGYEAGKQAAAEQIFEDLCRLGGCSRGIVLDPMDIVELKEKWGIK